MPDFKIKTGNIQDAFSTIKTPTLIEPPKPEVSAQEHADNEQRIAEIIASGTPVMHKKTPDLLTTPTMTGNLEAMQEDETNRDNWSWWQRWGQWEIDTARDIYRNLFKADKKLTYK